jgi:hypothetical protein
MNTFADEFIFEDYSLDRSCRKGATNAGVSKEDID